MLIGSPGAGASRAFAAVAALGLATALLVGACGGGSDGDAAPTPSTTASTTSVLPGTTDTALPAPAPAPAPPVGIGELRLERNGTTTQLEVKAVDISFRNGADGAGAVSPLVVVVSADATLPELVGGGTDAPIRALLRLGAATWLDLSDVLITGVEPLYDGTGHVDTRLEMVATAGTARTDGSGFTACWDAQGAC